MFEHKIFKMDFAGRELSVEIGKIADEDWENNWKQYYKPFRVGERLVIKPTWEEYIPEEQILFISVKKNKGDNRHLPYYQYLPLW